MRRLKKSLSVLLAVGLVLSLFVGAASAAIDAETVNMAAARMEALNLVRGREGEGLALQSTITRAEMVTIIVRAFNRDQDAALVQGTVIFPDTAGHWATGYIAIANQIIQENGFTLGLPDGTFNPNGNVTVAESIAFLMKFLGVPRNAAFSWPMDYLQGAVDAGLISSEDAATLRNQLSQPATRGLVFYLADHAFYHYELPSGRTVYTQYVDRTPPTLSVGPVVEVTAENAVTVSGTTDAEQVLVQVGSGTFEVPVVAGAFSVDVPLVVGVNAITVTAVDLAGNRAEEDLTVTRGGGTPAVIEASDITVGAGTTTTLNVVVKDENGIDIPGAEISGTSDVGVFNNGKFTAQAEMGTGTLTLTAGNVSTTVDVTVVAGPPARIVPEEESVAPNTPVTLTVEDAFGNPVTGAVFSVDSSNATVGANGIFVGFGPGEYEVTATKDGRSVSTIIGVFGSVAGLRIEAPDEMVGNDSSEYVIKVFAVDRNGYHVMTYEGPITLDTPLEIVSSEPTADGVATFNVRVSEAFTHSEVTLTAESGSLTESIDVPVVPQIATALEIEVGEYLPVNGAPLEGKVRVLDQTGAPMVTGETWVVDLTVTGNAYLDSDGTTSETVYADGFGSGFTLYAIDPTHLGPVTVKAVAEGLKSAEAKLEAVYTFAPSALLLTQVTQEPVKAAEDGVFLLKLQVVDKNGVPANVTDPTGLDVQLTFDHDTPEGLMVAYDTDPAEIDEPDPFTTHPTVGAVYSDGTFIVNVPEDHHTLYVGVMSTNVTGNIRVSARDSAWSMASVSSTVSFAAGELAGVGFKNEAYSVTAGMEVPLTVQMEDLYGNAAAVSGIPVRLYVPDDMEAYLTLNGRKGEYTATTDENGQVVVTVHVLGNYIPSYEVYAEADADKDGEYELISLPATLYVSNAITSEIKVETWADTDGDYQSDVRRFSFEAGEPMFIRAYLTDQNGLAISDPSFDADAHLQVSGIKLGQDVEETTVNWQYNDNGTTVRDDDFFEATLTARKAGSYVLTVMDRLVPTGVEGTRSFTIQAGVPEQLVVTEELKLVSGVAKGFTVRVADRFGNVVSPSRVTHAITFRVDFISGAGTYADVRASASGGHNDTFTIKQATNSVTIYLVSNDTSGPTLDFAVIDSGDLVLDGPIEGPYEVQVVEQ